MTIRKTRLGLRHCGLLALGMAGPVFAAPFERDLGEGLRLLRLREMPGDLPAGNAAAGPAVVDVRYATGDEAAATAFRAWLEFRAQRKTPVLLLVNAETAPAVLRALQERTQGRGLVVIGPATEAIRPDVPVTVAAEAEQAAYRALADGAAVAAVLDSAPAKVRHDEASLNRGRDAEEAAAPAVPAGPRPPVDAALQRAVHVHRTLAALRRL